MADPDKYISNLTVFSMNVDSGGMTAIVQITSISGPGISQEPVDVTDLDDTWKTFVVDIPDGGEVTVELIWDPETATHVDFIDMLADTVVTPCQIVYSDDGAAKYAWNGWLTNFEPTANRGEALTATATIKVTGAITVS